MKCLSKGEILIASERMKKPVALFCLTLGLSLPGAPPAAPQSASVVPLPYVRPDNPVPAAMPVPDVTGSIPRTGRIEPAAELQAGLDALSENNASEARLIRDRMAKGSLDHHILTWAIATSGLSGVPSYEIAAAQRELAGWPGLKSLRAHSERALYWENPTPAQVLAAFGATKPETVEGAMILARALVAAGRMPEAAANLRAIWISKALDLPTENKILREFAAVLTAADHKSRMDYLLYRGRVSQAKRFADLGKAQTLYKAWSSVISNAKNAEALLKVAEASRPEDPAILFMRIELLRRQDKYEEAAKLLAKAPKDAAQLINTTEWWNERRIVARGLFDRGDANNAYRIVANHAATEPADIADAEFHAGWYALRALRDPTAAEKHFRQILAASSRPLSASRALYWLGRTAEAGGTGFATDFYTKAAQYPGTFYGQLAAAQLDIRTLDVAYPSPSLADQQTFERREAVKAIDRFEAAGHERRADALSKALAEELENPGELAILTARAERGGKHPLSLQMGKAAFARGVNAAALAFPIGVIPAGANIAGSGKALAYAIARQESAFNAGAVSPANARGLLQLLPGTAQGVAKRHGLSYAPAKLTSDAGYNATLGAHYLGEQIEAFDGSYVLTFIAYNAGPRRVREWIERYGDPRGKPLDDVIDWIERIPFPETRNYVQRVMENYEVYKTRLGQKADIETDLRHGRQ
jgi:soluble lytic murein transglycosylase